MTDILSEIGGGGGPELHRACVSALFFSSRAAGAVFFLDSFGNWANGILLGSFNALVKGSRVEAHEGGGFQTGFFVLPAPCTAR